MNDIKHTPGPWAIVSLKSGGSYIVGHGNKTLIGTIYDGHTTEALQAEQQANAALIAAAPELLAACEQVRGELASVSQLNTFSDNKEFGEIQMATVRALTKRLVEAINKAKGV